ncbi:MAG: RluA family pseudouridine synthase [Firmicutes bacterium]|nr:RluA family pseudouridine synthase [Bacillota bacterium]
MTKNNEIIEIEISGEMEGTRLDLVLSACLEDMSRSYIQKLFEQSRITVNGRVCTKKKEKAAAGNIVRINMPEPESTEVLPEDIPLEIIHEDEDVIIVNKSAGMVVHPAPGNSSGTLVNGLMYHAGNRLSTINGVIRPGIVHRIDKDTSGLLMVAKNDRAHRSLAEQLAEHSITRRYTAIVYSNIKAEEGTVDAPIGRDPRNRMRNAVVPDGKSAVTHYSVLERFGDFTLVEARLETGRTHQIRVHMSYIKHPLLGDALYGPASSKIASKLGAGRQMLHAGVIGFIHPTTSEYVEFRVDPPEDFSKVLDTLRKKQPSE